MTTNKLSGSCLQQIAEKHRNQFERMLLAVEAETDREGTIPLEVVIAEVNDIIDASKA